MNPKIRRALLDYGPLLLFFVASKVFDIYVGTEVLIASVFAALALSYWFERKLTTTSIVMAALVLVFGGLTLYLHDDTFLKVKITIFYAFFGAVLLGGLVFDRLFIKYVLVLAVELEEKGWRILTLRLGIFFLGLAVLNEIVWRNFSTDIWVDFKFPGTLILTLIFMAAQTPVLMRHMIEEENNNGSPPA
jgi:intracellular septation protein